MVKRVSPSAARLLKYGRLNPNTASYWDERYLSGEYQAAENERYFPLRQEVINLIPPRSRVLDVGCGTGRFLAMLRSQKECLCTGIDVSRVSINLTKRKGFPAYVSELPDLPEGFQKERFDVCVVMETLEHVSYPFETLKALATVLRKNGRIIISVPDDCMKPEDFDEHVSSFNSGALHDLLGGVFNVEKLDSHGVDGFRYLVAVARKVSAEHSLAAKN